MSEFEKMKLALSWLRGDTSLFKIRQCLKPETRGNDVILFLLSRLQLAFKKGALKIIPCVEMKEVGDV